MPKNNNKRTDKLNMDGIYYDIELTDDIICSLINIHVKS